MSIDILLHETLLRVRRGEVFKASSQSEDDLKIFQRIANTIIYATDKGYIERIQSSKTSIGGMLYYDAISVISGLTYQGEILLQEATFEPNPADNALDDLLSQLPSHVVRERWEKALLRRKDDPSGAVTAARSTVEAALKWIIEQRGGKPQNNNKDLFNGTINILGIETQGRPVENLIEGIDLIMRGIGEMRNKQGDAHGLSSTKHPLSDSEAGLCVNLAGVVVLYFLEEFEKTQIRPTP